MTMDGLDAFPKFYGLVLLALVLASGCSLDTRNLSVIVQTMDDAVAVRDGMAPLPQGSWSGGTLPRGSDIDAPGAIDDAAAGGARDSRGGGVDLNDGSKAISPETPPIQNDAGLTGEIGGSEDGQPIDENDEPVLDAHLPNEAGPDSLLANASVVEKGLIGHWTFDEGRGTRVADSSGNGMTGTLVNDPTWSNKCAPAKISGANGSCLHFDGANQFVQLADVGMANFSGEISMTAWIKMDATGVGSPDQAMRNIMSHGYTVKPNAEVMMRLGNDNYVAGSWDGIEHQISSPAARDVGIWVHLASVLDGISWRLYRNGKLIALRLDLLGAVPVSQPWCIGAASSGTERFFRGFIDDVRLYNRALSPNEIANLASGTDAIANGTALQ